VRWIGRVFLWLVPAFAVWTLASPGLAALQAELAMVVANAWFPGLVSGWERSGEAIDFVTRLRAATEGRTGDLVFGVNPRIYSYGLPLFAALCLGTDPRRWAGLLLGAAALVPFLVWGVAFDLLKQVFITHGALAAPDILPTPFERNAIALGYQMGAILLPTAAPAVAWAVVHRAFWARWARI
jgi:hypothetical protein